MKKIVIYILAVFSLFILAACMQQESFRNDMASEQYLLKNETDEYAPSINPEVFTTEITNKYFSMPVGKRMVYEAKTEEGIERIETFIPGWKKKIMGVETLVFWDRVYLNGKLVEDTRDYIAQDNEGNVWYFGEDVDNYIDGILADHHGAWIEGIDGGMPGIWMKADPKVGDEYRQEFYSEAKDMGKVDAIGIAVTTPAGNFTDCVKIFEWSQLESATAYKYHCPQAGGTVLEEEGDERVELIEVSYEGSIALPSKYAVQGVFSSQSFPVVEIIEEEPVKELKKAVTEDEAKAIALAKVSGRVTDISIENKFGKPTYVIEIAADSGPETDVIIDIDTGKILGIET